MSHNQNMGTSRDRLTRKQRSALMSRVRSKDTLPERRVRKFLWERGFRYRLHRHDLPGKPDIVLSRLGRIILVHGCFWHGHNCSAGMNRPQSNLAYWVPKMLRNKHRDKESLRDLRKLGWKVLIVWECQVKNDQMLSKRLLNFLKN